MPRPGSGDSACPYPGRGLHGACTVRASGRLGRFLAGGPARSPGEGAGRRRRSHPRRGRKARKLQGAALLEPFTSRVAFVPGARIGTEGRPSRATRRPIRTLEQTDARTPVGGASPLGRLAMACGSEPSSGLPSLETSGGGKALSVGGSAASAGRAPVVAGSPAAAGATQLARGGTDAPPAAWPAQLPAE